MFSRLLDPKSDEFEEFYRACMGMLTAEHYYLRILAIGATTVLLNLKSKALNTIRSVHLEQKDFENKQISIEEFLKNHYIRSEDLQIAKNIHTNKGNFDIYTNFKVI